MEIKSFRLVKQRTQLIKNLKYYVKNGPPLTIVTGGLLFSGIMREAEKYDSREPGYSPGSFLRGGNGPR